MADITRRIGLSLGADLCWPICYEEILRRWNPALRVGGDLVRFEVDRITIEPFDLRAPCRYDLVLDRLTHWYHVSREWIKKSVVMDGLYVLNNPWSIQSMEKQTTYAAMMHLGLPVPDTWMIPPKEYDPLPDLQPTLERYAQLFDLGEIGEKVGYPHYMKPYDGGAWVAVSRIENKEALEKAYDASGKRVMHLQKAVVPLDDFIRCLGIGPQVRHIRYDAGAPLHERYQLDLDFLSKEDRELLYDMTLTINAFFGWDFNSCEVIKSAETYYPIDFANACPDSQVTSLHYHFPWLVTAMLRWSVFCAATGRKMRRNLNWAPFYEAREKNLPYRESLAAYGEIAREHFETERFETFCDEHLSELEEVAWEFFGTPRAKEAVRAKVEALFPEDEHESFTEHFWRQIQNWRDDQAS